MRYEIDRADRISAVSDDFGAFAVENGAPHLTPQKVVGTSLFSHISDAGSSQLYALLLQKVRTGSTVSFSTRCDSPDRRRLLRLTMTAAGEGRVQFETLTLSIEPRPALSLLDSTAARSSAVVRVCAWCSRVVGANGAWQPVEDALSSLGALAAPDPPRLSHGICPDCLSSVHSSIQPAPSACLV